MIEVPEKGSHSFVVDTLHSLIDWDIRYLSSAMCCNYI